MNPLVIAGVAGFVCYATSFGLVQVGRVDGNSTTYTAMNVMAAALVLASMIEQFNLGSLLTQVTYIGTGIVGLQKRRRPKAAHGAFRGPHSPGIESTAV